MTGRPPPIRWCGDLGGGHAPGLCPPPPVCPVRHGTGLSRRRTGHGGGGGHGIVACRAVAEAQSTAEGVGGWDMGGAGAAQGHVPR